MLEADYVASGGDARDIQGAEKNIGSEALSAWMFNEASQPDPFGLLGAMFIIEGLGSIKAQEWGRHGAAAGSALPDDAFSFLLYHGENDAEHMQEFEEMLRMVLPDDAAAASASSRLRQGHRAALCAADRGDRRVTRHPDLRPRAVRPEGPRSLACALSRPEPADRREAKQALLHRQPLVVAALAVPGRARRSSSCSSSW